MMLVSEAIPDQFRKDIVVPLHKRDSRFVTRHYRPISLVQTGLKDYQTIMYARALNLPAGKTLTGEYNFGSVKGRDRHMLIWLVNSVCLWEMHKKSHEGRVVVGVMDVDGAFPSIWNDGVDWLMWQAGVRGKLWRILRDMEKGLQGQIRVNGHFIDMKKHEDGGNQGAVSPPHRWKFLMSAWLQHCLEKDIGVKVEDIPIPGGGYVDDASIITYTVPEMTTVKRERDIFGDVWGFSWKVSKDQYIVRGRRQGVSAEVNRMSLAGLSPQDSVTILGETLGWNPDRCSSQVDSTIQKMKGATRMLEWLVWRGSVMSPELLESLIDIMVGSIATSHLIHTRVLESEMDTLDAIKAGVGKQFLGLTRRASRWGVLAELGWSSMAGKVIEAKLGFYSRIRRSEEGGLLNKLYKKFYAEMEQGGQNSETFCALGGFLVQVKTWLTKLGLLSFWGTGPFPKKNLWRKLVRPKIEEWDRSRWASWRQDKRLKEDWLVANKDVWGTQHYIKEAGRKDRQLLAAVRMLRTSADDSKRAEACRFCKKDKPESSEHFILECDKWRGERRRIVGPNPNSQSATWRVLTAGTPLSIVFLRRIRDEFEEIDGGRFVPWVAVLGREVDRGGVESIVIEVAKWMGTQKNG